MSSCDCCRIAFNEDNGPYIVPVNFAHIVDGEMPVLFFHGANEGKKITLLRKDSHVGFEMDTKHALVRADTACGHSFCYQSIIGKGKVEFVEDSAEKRHAFELIMEKYAGKGEWDFPEKVLSNTCVMRLNITEWSCKEH